jgi:amino-acid N-acetyltransferase
MSDLLLRQATEQDADALHALIAAHVQEGHLLPRQLDDIRAHATRFVVGEQGGAIQACAELAPLSKGVAEVRSLVVSGPFRHAGVAARLVDDLGSRARAAGFKTLSAFTHDPGFFVRRGFSIVPRLWVSEKIATDCSTCPFLLGCRQYAMVLPLESLHDAQDRDHSLAARHA